jgi:hypothetical protein
LPPRIIEKSFSWEGEIKGLPAQKPRSVDKLLTSPIGHGGLLLDQARNRVVLYSSDGNGWLDFSTAHLGPLSALYKPLSSAERKLFASLSKEPGAFPFASGYFRVQADKLEYLSSPKGGPLWALDIGFEVLSVNHGPRQALLGWTAYPARLFHVGSDLKTFTRIRWSEDSEPIAFLGCGGSRQMLVENVRNGLSRIVFFESGKPTSYSIFDFSGTDRQSEISVVAAASCFEIFVAGSFGLSRIRY